MKKDEFMKKLSAIEDAEPDQTDLAMLAEIKKTSDQETMNFSEFKTLMDYSGRISLRVPKSLHKKLDEAAKLEGVSLNQYALYKLSQ